MATLFFYGNQKFSSTFIGIFGQTQKDIYLAEGFVYRLLGCTF